MVSPQYRPKVSYAGNSILKLVLSRAIHFTAEQTYRYEVFKEYSTVIVCKNVHFYLSSFILVLNVFVRSRYVAQLC